MNGKRHTPEQIIAKLRKADALLATGATSARSARSWRIANRRFIVGAISMAAVNATEEGV